MSSVFNYVSVFLISSCVVTVVPTAAMDCNKNPKLVGTHLTCFEVETKEINTEASDAPVNITIGFYSFEPMTKISVVFRHEDSKISDSVDFSMEMPKGNQISGNSSYGTYQWNVLWPKASAQGKWRATQVNMYTSYWTTYNQNNEPLQSSARNIEQIGVGDTRNPEVLKVHYDPIGYITGGDEDKTVRINVTVWDDYAGVGVVRLKLKSPSGSTMTYKWSEEEGNDFISGNATNGTVQFAFAVDGDTEVGVYAFYELRVYDKTGNQGKSFCMRWNGCYQGDPLYSLYFSLVFGLPDGTQPTFTITETRSPSTAPTTAPHESPSISPTSTPTQLPSPRPTSSPSTTIETTVKTTSQSQDTSSPSSPVNTITPSTLMTMSPTVSPTTLGSTETNAVGASGTSLSLVLGGAGGGVVLVLVCVVVVLLLRGKRKHQNAASMEHGFAIPNPNYTAGSSTQQQPGSNTRQQQQRYHHQHEYQQHNQRQQQPSVHNGVQHEYESINHNLNSKLNRDDHVNHRESWQLSMNLDDFDVTGGADRSNNDVKRGYLAVSGTPTRDSALPRITSMGGTESGW